MTLNVVVLTALDLEYKAVQRRLVKPQVQLHDRGTLFEVGALRGTSVQVALALTGKGNQPAAVLAERAIQEFEPAAVLFVGVAGALQEGVRLGDVVVATHVYAYHGGTSEDDGFKARPRVWEAEHGIHQLARHVARLDDWAERTSPNDHVPEVHFGVIAAGEVVHNSRVSYEADLIRHHYNDALAIEMESAGVAQAGHLSGAPVVIVRGISDKADGTKTSDADGLWQPRAADNAAAFAARLIEELVKEQENRSMHRRRNQEAVNVINCNHDGQVGIQAGKVSGSSVSINTSTGNVQGSCDFSAELSAIREELARAYSFGVLDSSTYEEAQKEIDIAGKSLRENTPEGKNTFLFALKKLRGLIEEVTDVAAKVASLIMVVNSLS